MNLLFRITALSSFLFIGGAASAHAQTAKPDEGGDKQPAPAVQIVWVNTDDPRNARVCITAEDRGGGVSEVKLTAAGREVRGTRVSATGDRSLGTGRDCPPDGWFFRIPLPPGRIQLEATAYSTGGVASQPARQEIEGAAPRGNLYVLVVGVDTFPGLTSREQLRHAENDARTFAAAIAVAAAPLFRAPVIIDSLFGARATRAAMESKFNEIEARADTNDTFIFFYAGHGTVAPNKGGETQFYLATPQAASLADGSNLHRTSVSATRLQDWLNIIPTRRKLVLLDACQSAEFIEHFERGKGHADPALQRVGGGSRTAILAAAAPSDPAQESDLLGHGLFTEALLRSLGFRDSLEVGRVPEERHVSEIVTDTRKALRELAREYGIRDQDLWDHPARPDFSLIYR